MPAFPEGQDPLDSTYGQSVNLNLPQAPPPPSPMPWELPGAIAEETTDLPAIGRFLTKSVVQPVADKLGLSETLGLNQVARGALSASPSDQPVDGYNPVPRIVGTKYEPYLSQFMGDVNPDQTNARMASIDQHLDNRRTMAQGGWTGTALALGMQVAEPWYWFIPGGEAVAAARLGVAASALEHMAPLARGALTAGEVGLATVPQQAILQSTNPTQTFKESAWNVASNAVLAGIIGSGGAYLSTLERARAANALEASRRDFQAPANAPEPHGTDLSPPARLPAPAPTGELAPGTEPAPAAELAPGAEPPPAAGELAPASVGAAAADRRTMELEPFQAFGLRNLVGTFGPDAQRYYDAATTKSGWLSPVSRIFSRGSLPARQYAGDLTDTALHFTQEREGITPAQGGLSISDMRDQMVTRYTMLNNGVLEHYFADYRNLPETATMRGRAYMQDIRGQAQDRMSFRDFKTEVYKAMVDGDTHAVPQVEAAAKALRAQVMDPVKGYLSSVKDMNGQAIMGDVIEPPKGDRSFAPRLWSKEAISRDPNRFDSITSNWLSQEQAKKASIQTRLRGLNDQLAAHNVLGKRIDGKIARATASGKEARVAELMTQKGMHEARLADIRQAIEEEVAKWEGNTSAEAKAALKARTNFEIERASKAAAGLYKGREARLTSADRAVDRAVRGMLDAPTDLSADEIMSRAREIRHRIDTDPDGRLPYDEPKKDPHGGWASSSDDFRGSLNARAYAIPTKDVIDFVHSDLEHVIPAYLKNVIPDALHVERFGDIRGTIPQKRINEHYDSLTAKAETPEAAAKLDAKRKRELSDVVGMRDRYRGVYGLPTTTWQRNLGRMSRAVMQYNAITMLGSSVLNRLQDVANATSRRGLMGYMQDGFLPYIGALTRLSESGKEAREMVKEWGIGVDTSIGHMATSFSDISNDHLPGNRFERALQTATKGSMWLNLHGPWTDGWRQAAAMAASADYLRSIERIVKGTASERDIRMMAYAGIDQPMAARVWDNFQNGHTEINGVKLPNTADWDPAVERAYVNAIRKEANTAVAQPGQERPFLFDHPVGRAALQFRSFEYAAWHKIMLSNLQMGDARALQGMLSMLAMGALSAWAYSVAAGRVEQMTGWQPQDWVKEALLRSGMLGPFSTMNTLQAKLTNGRTDLFRAIGAGKPPQRRDQTNVIEDALGPTYKELLGLGTAIPHVFSGTTSARDVNNARQTFIPLQNYMFFRRLLDEAEDGFDRRFGIRPMNRNPRTYPGMWTTPQ